MQLTYSVGEPIINISDTHLVMSTTLIDPTQQEGASEVGVPATPTLPTAIELQDPSTYKVYRPPNVSGPTSSERQCEVYRLRMRLY